MTLTEPTSVATITQHPDLTGNNIAAQVNLSKPVLHSEIQRRLLHHDYFTNLDPCEISPLRLIQTAQQTTLQTQVQSPSIVQPYVQ